MSLQLRRTIPIFTVLFVSVQQHSHTDVYIIKF